jgi:hypothetical protein
MKKHTKKLIISAGALALTVGVTWLFSLTVVNPDSQQARVTSSTASKYPTSDEALKTLMSGTREAEDRDFESACIAGAIKCGKIVVEKSAIPESNLDFTFITNVPNYPSFILDDDGTLDNSALPNIQTIFTSPNGSYIVAEMPSPSEYETILSCSDPSGNSVVLNGSVAAVAINMNNAETVSCVFRNMMTPETAACDTWTEKADVPGPNTSRAMAIGLSIGDKGYVGTGTPTLTDFWEYDPINENWTQKADVPYSAYDYRYNAVAFSIGDKGYVGTGVTQFPWWVELSDFWEYDPEFDIWTQKADFGGVARQGAVGFSIGNRGYVGTGRGDYLLSDFWEYDPTSLVNGLDVNGNPMGAWTQKADFGGTARRLAVGFSIESKGYIGTGDDSSSELASADFWEYDPTSLANGLDVNGNPMGAWTQKADFGGGPRSEAAGFSIGDLGYLGTGSWPAAGFLNSADFWEYDPTSLANGLDVNGNPMGAWTQKADYGGGSMSKAVGFSIGNNGYLGTGYTDVSPYTVPYFWEYCP